MTQAPPLPKKSPPRWKRILILGLLLGCVGGAALFYWAMSEPGRHLADAIEEADRLDPGWRFADLEAKRPFVADDENAALVVLTARGLQPRMPDMSDEALQLERDLAALPPGRRLTPEMIKAFRSDRAKFEPVLKAAAPLVNMPRGRYPTTWKPMIYGIVLTSPEARPVADLLFRDAILRAEDGDIAGALDGCLAIYNVARSVGDEPLLMSQLVRVGCRQQAIRALERTLAQGEASEAHLVHLQKELADDLGHNGLLIALRGDRAATDNGMEAVQNGQTTLRQLVGLKDQGIAGLTERIREGSPGYQRACLLLFNNQYVEIAKLPAHEQAAKLKELADLLEQQPAAVRLLVPAIKTIGTSFHNHDAELRCAVTALAVERYRLKHGNWPATLDELAPDFLPSVPLDPFNGHPLRYRRTEDGVIIYSVGADLEDNGGEATSQKARHLPGQDVRFRLWNVDRRRQPPPMTTEPTPSP